MINYRKQNERNKKIKLLGVRVKFYWYNLTFNLPTLLFSYKNLKVFSSSNTNPSLKKKQTKLQLNKIFHS